VLSTAILQRLRAIFDLCNFFFFFLFSNYTIEAILEKDYSLSL